MFGQSRPIGEGRHFAQARELFVRDDGENLIRARDEGEFIALRKERVGQALRKPHGVTADFNVKVVLKERFELNPEEAPLRKNRARLLHRRVEVRQEFGRRDDEGLPEERPHLRAADVEDVREARDVFKRHVVLFRRKAVAEARPVDVKRQMMAVADGAKGLEFVERVERAVLRRVRDVDESGMNRKVARRIVQELLHGRFDRLGRNLPFLFGKREDLVARSLDRARLVPGDVARVGREDAFVVAKDRADHGRVRLRSAHEKPHLRVGRAAGLADELGRPFAVLVRPVARRLIKIRGGEFLQNARMRAFQIVAFEVKHRSSRFVW